MTNQKTAPIVSKKLLFPFALVTFLFFAWGIPGSMTEPLISAFKDIFKGMSNLQASLVQAAFYGAYFVWAIPAAFLVKKTSYKTTIMVGILIYAIGAYLFIPASQAQEYNYFLVALFTLATGISFLETSANPYIIAMGDEKTAVQRLNLAQSFFPFGSWIGTIIAGQVILSNLKSTEDKIDMTVNQLATLQTEELAILASPYGYIAIIAAVFFVIFGITKMPAYKDEDNENFFAVFGKNLKRRRYLFSLGALFCAMAAQFGTFAFIIPYLKEYYTEAGELVTGGRAGALLAYGVFLFMVMRFVCTWLMKFINPSKLLAIMSSLAVFFTICAILLPGNIGGICLILVCGCVSLLFPTIYGIGLKGMSSVETKVGASGLIMTIIAVGIMNPLQGFVIDKTSINMSYICTLIPFIILVIYGLKIEKFSNRKT